MSRNYDEYCEECKGYNARGDNVSDNLDLAQCLDCGACYVTISKSKKLKTKGTNQKAWNEAVSEAYEHSGDEE